MTKTQLPSCSYTTKHAILCLSFLLFLSRAGAQTNGSPSDTYGYARFSPSMAIIIVVLVAALFIMGFFSVYIRHCSEANGEGGSIRRLSASMRRRATTRGLDAQVIGTFPTFEYSAVKGLKIGKGALECAVCLNEFEDSETLRLIPKCDHVFHPECIDAWLTSHVTCPVCRANLVPQPGEIFQLPDLEPESNELSDVQNPDIDQVSIQVVDRDQEEHEQTLPELRQPSVKQNRPPRSRSVRSRLFGKFPRSHSTGHSLIQPGENTDRFTLRLPEDVRKKMMSRALNRTNSCVVVLPREASSRRGYRLGLGEGSSRGGRSFGRSDRWVFSMAPPFFSRSLSVRSPKVVADDGEGSTSSRTPRGTKTAVKETGLVPAESVRPPV